MAGCNEMMVSFLATLGMRRMMDGRGGMEARKMLTWGDDWP